MTDAKQKHHYGWLLRGTSTMVQLILLGLVGAEENTLLDNGLPTSIDVSNRDAGAKPPSNLIDLDFVNFFRLDNLNPNADKREMSIQYLPTDTKVSSVFI